MTQGVSDWTVCGFSGLMGRRGKERSPWYDMTTAAVAMIARPYIPQGGKVYDLGCSTGNVGRVLAPTLHERKAQFVALDGCRDAVVAYCGPGRAIMADVASYPYKPFDVAVAFLTFMDLPATARRRLLSTLRSKMRPGGAIIIISKEKASNGSSPAGTFRQTSGCNAEKAGHGTKIWKKRYDPLELHAPLCRNELGPDAIEAFRLGGFVGWLIEG